MKSTVKISSFALVLVMLLTFVAGCNNTEEPAAADTSTPSASVTPAESEPVDETPGLLLPLTDETVAFSLWTVIFPNLTSYTEDFSESLSLEVLEEKTNVHIDVNAVSFFSATENLTMLLASDELFDLTAGMSNFYSAGVNVVYENGMIVDVLEYAEYMPNYLNKVYGNDSIAKCAISADGKMPYVYSVNDVVYLSQGPVIRTDWLDKIGWSAGDLVTYEDWHTVLTAFKSELGMTSPLWLASTGGSSTCGLGGGFGVSNAESLDSGAPSYIYQIDGLVKFAPYEDGFYDWLELVSTWYAEGLIYPEFINGVGAPDNADLAASKFGVWWCSTATMANIFDLNEDEGLGISAITEPVLNKGDKYHFVGGRDTYITVSGGVAVSSRSDNIELLCRYLDYHYTDEGSVIAKYGREDVSFYYDDEGKPKLTEFILNNADMPKSVALSVYTANVGAGMNFLDLTIAGFNNACQAEGIEIWTAQQGESWDFPNFASLTADENSEYSPLWADISTYVQEYVLNVITGGAKLESSYDKFIADLGTMDVERCIQLKQAALDRYNSR